MNKQKSPADGSCDRRQSTLKRSGFKRKTYERRKAPLIPLAEPARAVLRRADGNARLVVMPKSEPVRSEAYRRLVAMLPCDLCGVSGYSQAAHPNTGKGAGLKTDDRECFPLCCVRPGEPGCHARFDQGALMSKEQRRAYEPQAGERARAAINHLGLWPKGLACLE
jgi:hypothetical protein